MQPVPFVGLSAFAATNFSTTAGNGEGIPHPTSTNIYAVTNGGSVLQMPLGMVYVPAGAFTCNTGTNATNVTIPTAYQWEKAARGTNAYLYPWGNSQLSTCSGGLLSSRMNYNRVVCSYYRKNFPILPRPATTRIRPTTTRSWPSAPSPPKTRTGSPRRSASAPAAASRVLWITTLGPASSTPACLTRLTRSAAAPRPSAATRTASAALAPATWGASAGTGR